MRWCLLDRVRKLVPGQSATAVSRTSFPEELFADHFPSFPVTPGVLLTEMGAQLSGLLVQATMLERQGVWRFPFLATIDSAKFRRFVAPGTVVEIRTRIDAIRDDGAVCKAQVASAEGICARMTLMLVFDPEGGAGSGDPLVLRSYMADEFRRLASPWLPPEMR
jgi:3-hydroxyacyl-[acyl-carrier-protein] dehydratase